MFFLHSNVVILIKITLINNRLNNAFLINILLYRWSAEHCIRLSRREILNILSTYALCVYITRICFTYALVLYSKDFKSILLHFVCCFIFHFLCNDLGKMSYKNETRPTHDLLSLYCVSGSCGRM